MEIKTFALTVGIFLISQKSKSFLLIDANGKNNQPIAYPG